MTRLIEELQNILSGISVIEEGTVIEVIFALLKAFGAIEVIPEGSSPLTPKISLLPLTINLSLGLE